MSNVSAQPTMEDLLHHVGDKNNLKVGDKVEGNIINIAKNEVMMDVENIGLGIIRGRELYNEEYLAQLAAGQRVEAVIVSLENELGVLELSFRAIGRDKIWEDINKSFAENKTVEAKIRDANRGGFLVKVNGVYGFLPASLLSPAHTIKQTSAADAKNLSSQMKKYVGQTFNVKILSVNEENDTVIVSEKSVSDELSVAKLNKYKVGDSVTGKVVGTVDFGLFVRFDDDLEGLVHISEIAWKKISDPKSEYKVGDTVTARIVEIDSDNRINLSIKQTLTNPWDEFAKGAKIGDKFTGQISKIVSYGIIVNDERDIQGLCHITQISENGVESPAKIHEMLKVGESKEFTILSLEGGKLFLTLLPLEQAQKIEKEEQAKQQEHANNQSHKE